MKKCISLLAIILPLLSSFTSPMDPNEDPKTIEENRRSRSSHSSSSSSISAAAYLASAPCIVSAPQARAMTQEQKNQEQIKKARAEAAARHKVLTSNDHLEARVNQLATQGGTISTVSNNASSSSLASSSSIQSNNLSNNSFPKSSCSMSISDLDRRKIPCMPSAAPSSTSEIKQPREGAAALNFAFIPQEVRDPWRIISQLDGIDYLCPRLRAQSWQPMPMLERFQPTNSTNFPSALSNTHSAIPGSDHSVHIYSLATGERQYTLTGHTDEIYTVIFSPDGKYIATESRDLTARIWSTETGICLHTLQDPNYWIRTIAFSPDSKSIATAPFGRGEIRLWDITTGTIVHSIPRKHDQRSYVDIITFSPQGRYIAYSVGPQETLYLYEINTGKCLRVLPAENNDDLRIKTVIFSPNGKHLATESYHHDYTHKTIHIWDIATGKCLYTLPKHTGLSFSPNGNTLVTMTKEGKYLLEKNVIVFDINTGFCIKTLEIPEKEYLKSASFSHDGKHIITVSNEEGSIIRIWDAATGKCLHIINHKNNEGNFTPLLHQISPNDKHISLLKCDYRSRAELHAFKSLFNINTLTLEQAKFLVLCEALTVETKMPLWVIARKAGLDIKALRATFYSFNHEMQKLMRKTYGLSDTAFIGPVIQPPVPIVEPPVAAAQRAPSNSSGWCSIQ